ncbi:putative gypsy-29-i dr [Trichonephila clavata]|uniref:Putative gypsy-29-i dr n=1 Tax=Trichonephila clavata TaxID=2740835 RepID=A0A8X6KAA8_TRICU|nr:putative gypsy-29-i dr [Trichonephila clavata]
MWFSLRGHASFICHFPPSPRGSSVAQPSQLRESNSQANAPFLSSSGSTNHGNNTQRGTTNLNSSESRRKNSNRNSTPVRYATTNPSNSVNFVKTQTIKRSLIPIMINNHIEIQAQCDPCAEITIIQQSCIPADAVIHQWTHGQFQVVDHKINRKGWNSLILTVGNIEHMMLIVSIYSQFPFPLILGFDWQHQVQASINCITSNEASLPSIEDVVLPELNTKILPSQVQLIPKFAKLSRIQQAELDAATGKFSDVFYSDDDNIGLCPHIEFKIDLQHDKSIRFRPYRLSEPDRQFLNMQIQKWLKHEICHPSNSNYAAPAFIVEQPLNESTPRRVVIDYSRTINSITKTDPHPINDIEDVIIRIVGKCYISKRDVKSAFNTTRIKETDIFKTGFVTPDEHYRFLRMPFGVTNGPSTMAKAIKLTYEHLVPHNANTYIDDISTSHET